MPLNENNTRWRSTFYKVIRFSFDVVDVDENYQTLLLGHPSRKYGWVMSRKKAMTSADYQRALEVFKNNYYDVSRFSKVPQLPEQIGKDGFQKVTD
ncbi:MAG: apolipoprotein D and lipocalin family protein [Cryomorphaceae bacterium]|jgi:apolipoprotein D and lipocalin family protein